MHTEALGTLGCPRCGAPLEFTAAALHCQACARGYPLIGEIPCLVPDPPLFRAHWLGQLEEYLAITETRVRELGNERRGEHLLPQTRQRLLSVIRAMDVERAGIRERFAALVAGVERLPASAIPTSFVRAGDLPILKCYENVFRDFAWGQRESKLALEHVARLASAALGQMAVFGAGAGRLALDVHRTLAPEQSFALDINPLPLLIADELMRGRTLELYEFPIAPHTAEDVAVLERLSYPESVRPGLTLVFADARTPPFRPASLDTVLTPWFIDAVGRDVRETAATIRRVLRPGGMWLNLGPLRFEGPLSRVYAIEEVLELVKQSGFELVQHFREDVPYFDSPFSGSRRNETVFGFAARKTGVAPAVHISDVDLPWIANAHLPIPITPELATIRRSSVFTTGVISMIDGTRSIADLAATLGQSWGIAPALLEDQLRAFLARLIKG